MCIWRVVGDGGRFIKGKKQKSSSTTIGINLSGPGRHMQGTQRCALKYSIWY